MKQKMIMGIKWKKLAGLLLTLAMTAVLLQTMNTTVYAEEEDTTPTPLTFTAEEAYSTITFSWQIGSDVKVKANSMNVLIGSTQLNNTWTSYTAGTKITFTEVGASVSFIGSEVKTESEYHFTMAGKIAASGDVTSLTNGTGGDCSLEDYQNAYQFMFYYCRSLTSAPALPSTKLSRGCYYAMFSNCASLTAAPALPAIKLSESCYEQMFKKCTSLTEAPALSATELSDYCYEQMFLGCTGLTEAPALPATELSDYCYERMFYGCTGLTRLPILPATSLQHVCYSLMFYDCTGLTLKDSSDAEYEMTWSIPSDATEATEEADWNQGMFDGCPNVVCNSDGPAIGTIYYMAGTKESGKSATCTEDGWKDYYKDPDGELYADSGATLAIEDLEAWKIGDGKISATGHSYGDPVYTWSKSDDGTWTCQAERVCAKDASHIETEIAVVTSEESKAATCTAKGTTTYTATFTNSAFKTQTKEVENIAALGHKYGDPVYTWSTDGKTCTAVRTCTACGNKDTEEATVTSKVSKAATCTAKGTTTYTATFTNSAFKTQTKEVENIAALGHKYGDPVYTWSTDGKTCTAVRTCTVCGNKDAEEATITSKVSKAATCTAKGNTTYTAAFKNSVFKTQSKSLTNLSALGHKWSSWKTTKAATVFKTGTKARTCSVCKKTATKTLAKLKATLKLSSTKKTIKVKKTYTLVISKLAKGDSIKSVKSSKTAIATVKKLKTGQYKITGKKKGSTVITVILKSGKKATCKITVK